MNREQRFLRTICQAPEDDTPRLAYADWLEENGRPERAELIRLQIERARRPSQDQTRLAPGKREAALLEAHREEWLAPLPDYARDKVQFERGFPGRASHVEMEDFLHWDEALWRVAPVTVVELTDYPSVAGEYRAEGEKERLLRALAAKPELAHLLSLNLVESGITPGDLKILLASPHLGGLHDLQLGDNGLGDEGARVVARARGLSSLNSLGLGANAVGPPGVAALTRSPLLKQLRTLDLSNNNLGDGGVELLAASRRARNLTQLNLLGCGITDAGARSLAASPHLGGLTYLCVFRNDLGPEGQAALRERFGGPVVLEFGP
jgi:uncharacterized protein (TIGR02996 family)